MQLGLVNLVGRAREVIELERLFGCSSSLNMVGKGLVGAAPLWPENVWVANPGAFHAETSVLCRSQLWGWSREVSPVPGPSVGWWRC